MQAADAHRRSRVIDEQGYCNIVGRVKDMIIRARNVSPREIEEFLYRHPAVLDVAWSVFPTPSTVRRLRVHPLRDGMTASMRIREFCRGKLRTTRSPLRALRGELSAHDQRQGSEVF